MCKVGDIIIIESYRHGNTTINQHSFIVISDEKGEIEGFPYDMIANVMSSFKNDEQKKRKLSYPGNFEVKSSDTATNPHNNKDGFVKTDQLYYFKKDKIKYERIGSVNIETMNAIFDFIENGTFELEVITDNL